MLTITDVWTNAREQPESSALWFAAIDSTGQWWWLIVGIGKHAGFTNAYLHKIEGRQELLRKIEADEEESGERGAWAPVGASEALQRVRAEFDRARRAPWSQAYADKWRVVSQEYRRFQAAVEGTEAPMEYWRGGRQLETG